MTRELTYLDFDVLLERTGGSGYLVRVVNAPAGQTPPIRFTVPFTALELENFLLRIGRPRRVVRRVDAPETAAIKKFGGELYDALFHDDLRDNLRQSLSEAAAKGAGLRIRLRLSDVPELAELPWEFIYDQARNRFLCLSDRSPLVRFLELPDPPRPLPVSPPLNVLVMIASPSDYPELDVEQEWAKLRDALSPLEQAGQVRLVRLEAATLAVLRQQLRRSDWHVLHFIGHGTFNSQIQDGALVIEDQAGRGRLISGQDLGVLLYDHHQLRLVVLNACEGARSDPTDPFAGTAQSLLQQGVPAVVAMQFEITDQAAIILATELYLAVADGYPLDAALAQARKAIWADGNQVEWATAVLYLRAPDGRIFDVAPTPPGVSTPLRPEAAASVPAKPTKTTPTPMASAAGTAEPGLIPTSNYAIGARSSTRSHTLEHPSKLSIWNQKWVVHVVFSPDGRFLATSSYDQTVRIWDTLTGQHQHTLGYNERSREAQYSADGRLLITLKGKIARIWAAETGQQLHTLPHDDSLWVAAFSPDGRRLATGSYNDAATIWDIDSGQQLQILAHYDTVSSVMFSLDGRRLITVSGGNLWIWNSENGQHLHSLTSEEELHGVALSSDGRRLASAKDKTIRIWDIQTGQQVHSFAHEDEVRGIAFSPDGRWLATRPGEVAQTGRSTYEWRYHKFLRIWDIQTGQQVHSFAHEDEVRGIAFSPDGRWLATGSKDRTARIWDVRSGQILYHLGHQDGLLAVAFSPDGRLLATGSDGNRAVLWKLAPPDSD